MPSLHAVMITDESMTIIVMIRVLWTFFDISNVQSEFI